MYTHQSDPLTSCNRQTGDVLLQPNSLMPPHQGYSRCGVLQSAPHCLSGRKLHSTACRGFLTACLRAVCRMSYRILVLVIGCDLSGLVVANYVDWSLLVGICPRTQEASPKRRCSHLYYTSAMRCVDTLYNSKTLTFGINSKTFKGHLRLR